MISLDEDIVRYEEHNGLESGGRRTAKKGRALDGLNKVPGSNKNLILQHCLGTLEPPNA